MPGDVLPTGEPDTGSHKGPSGTGPFGRSKALQIIISAASEPVAVLAGSIRVRKFRRDVIKQMSLTVTNLHPEVTVGGTDRRGYYTEIHMDFGDFRLRITRAIYNPGRQDLWADVGSALDPATFFRLDYVLAALRRLDNPGDIPELSECPNSLPALDATVWAVHDKLARHFSGMEYSEAKRMVQQVMHEEAALAHAEGS